MGTIPQTASIVVDVSCDWLVIHCLSQGHCGRLPNKPEGHAQVVQLATEQGATVCCEAAGGQEWKLLAALDATGVATRQLPQAQSELLMCHWFEHNGERLCDEPGYTGQDRPDRHGAHRAVHGLPARCMADLST